MQITLVMTGLLMGLAGGPHCVAMCGAACAGIGRGHGGANTRAMWFFQAGRLLGYSFWGAAVAASMQGLGWLSVHSEELRPVWTLFHVAAAMLGLVLLWQARQPVWLEAGARSVWQKIGTATAGLRPGLGNSVPGGTLNAMSAGAPLLIGALWSLLPCGLLFYHDA